MNLVEIEKIVANLEQRLLRNSNSYSAGLIKSSFRGSGLQFKEHQVYTHGDDVRFIDWKLSARSTQTFVKTFEEERNVEIVILLDLTPTLLLGHMGKSKLYASIEICALMYLLAAKTHDLVKLVLMQDENQIELPIKSGKEGIIQMISSLERLHILNEQGNINTNYNFVPILDENKRQSIIRSYVAKKKEVILLTDFHYFNTFEGLNKLLGYRNFHCFRVVCDLDEVDQMPFSFNATNLRSRKNQFIFGKVIKEKDQVLPIKRWKRISVHDRYLELFIKELI
jgi:uncharacterized protein (DUF58 family)